MGRGKAGIKFYPPLYAPARTSRNRFARVREQVGNCGGFRSLEPDGVGYKTVMAAIGRITPETAGRWGRVRFVAGNSRFDAIGPGIESPIGGSSRACPRCPVIYPQPAA